MSNVTFGGVLIGTASGGTGTTPLVVTFKAAANAAAVQAVLRTVLFASVSANPTILSRILQTTLSDGDGGTSTVISQTVTVQAVNTPPTIVLGGNLNYIRGGAAVFIAAMGTVTDPDSANFNGGRLTVQIAANAEATDRLRIVNQGTGLGRIGVNGNILTYGGVAIGTFTGGSSTTALVITLNAAADAEAVQTLLRSIEFTNTAFSLSLLPRTIKATLTDGDGGTSVAASKTISVI
jgi:hypothetical protein